MPQPHGVGELGAGGGRDHRQVVQAAARLVADRPSTSCRVVGSSGIWPEQKTSRSD
jgi:hypothetical protein